MSSQQRKPKFLPQNNKKKIKQKLGEFETFSS